MNARIAAILKDRLSQFTYVDRIAGMVRTAQMERAGQVVKLPVAIDVDDDLACDASTLRDMVPDERYACMVYFEDRGFQRITSRTRGTSFRSSIRMVCWVNTAKFGGDPMAGERIMQQFLAEVHQPGPVNTDTLVGLRTTAETSPERGGGLFGAYTYPESSRQYLLWPFDAFAIDIAAEYRLRPGCEEEPVPGDDSCWTPPTTKRRRNPSEFTCEELQDPETGLTAEQLGAECLDCEGGGGGGTVTITGTDGLTELPPVDCGDTYALPVTHIFFEDNVGQPSGVLDDLPTVVEENDGHLYPDIVVPSRFVKNTAGNNANTFRATLEDLVNDTLPIAQDGFWSLKDTDGNELNTGSIPSNASADITAPDATVTRDGLPFGTVLSGGTIDVPSDCTPCDPELSLRVNGGRVVATLDLDCGLQEYDILVTTESGVPVGNYDNVDARIEVGPGQVQLQDTASNPIGSPVSIEPESGGNTIIAPDGAVSINGTPVGDVLSGGSIDVPVTLDGATASGTWTGSAYDIAKQANILREYTAGATWNKPAGLKELFVLVAGAGGGGGGAGRRAGAITGASGGGGGAVRWLRIDAASLSASEVISIGAGGVGGPGGTVIAGTAGGSGGSTSFGSFITAAGGSGGGTSATSGAITGGAGGTTAGIRFFLPGAAGGNASANSDGSAGTNGWAQTTAGPGGGGGGATTNTPATYGGGAGGGVFEWNGSAWALVAGPTGPAASAGNGSNGSNDQCLHLLQSFTEVPTIGLGTGGAGGAGNQGTTGGNGGNGGRAAGGGGGGSIQGAGGTGGNGGNGGDGFCILIEIY